MRRKADRRKKYIPTKVTFIQYTNLDHIEVIPLKQIKFVYVLCKTLYILLKLLCNERKLKKKTERKVLTSFL